MAAEVPQTLEYKGDQLNATPMLMVENFTNWKKRVMCHIVAGQSKAKGQWTGDERKAANLDQRLKSLILSILPDDQINSVINCETSKSTLEDLILYHGGGPSDVKESMVIDLKLCYNTFKFKEDSPDDEEDARDSQEYLNDLEEEFQERALLAKSKRFFKKGSQRFSSAKATDETLIPLVGPLECDISFSEQIDIVQLGIVSQAKLKLLLRTMISGVKDHEVRILLAFDACGCKGRDTKENPWRSLFGSTSYVDLEPRKSSSLIIENNSLKTLTESSNEETPFSLTYGSESVVPIEISMETKQIKKFKVRKNEKRLREKLDLLEEQREIASIQEAHYKQKLDRFEDENEDEDKDEIKGLIWVYNHIANKREESGHM
ncbi:hypothetical protein Tco_0339399 [Tanacetum coccineum]